MFNYRPQTKFLKVMFLQVSVCPQGGLHGCQGVCVVAGGICGCRGVGGMCGCCWGHAWLLGACMVARGWHVWLLGGMHGCLGACMAPGGHAWWRGCAWQRGHAWQRGACMVRVAWVGYDEIRRYDQWAGGTHPTGTHSCFLMQQQLPTPVDVQLKTFDVL